MYVPYMPSMGDFGVVPTPGIGGVLIRFGQWLNGDGFADYEHAFVYVGSGLIVESQADGARMTDLTNYNPSSIAWYEAPRFKGEQIANEAVNLIGTPYSWMDYFALAAVRFNLPMSSKILRKYVADSGHMICSQLVDEAYLRAGVHLFNDGRLPGDVTPADLYQLIVERRNL